MAKMRRYPLLSILNIFFIFYIISLTACTPKDVAYFQDKRPGTQALMDTMFNVTSIPFKLRPGDKISINVSSRNSTLSQQFNMGGGQYLIDDDGNIDDTC